jgi:hypothetical protein
MEYSMKRNYIPQVSSEIDELISLVRTERDFAVSVRMLLDSGTPLTCADVDGFFAKLTGDRVLTYHLSDPVKALLATFKAKNVNAIDIPVGNGHTEKNRLGRLKGIYCTLVQWLCKVYNRDIHTVLPEFPCPLNRTKVVALFPASQAASKRRW